eukprot:3663033-Prymnesium_polylepis.3
MRAGSRDAFGATARSTCIGRTTLLRRMVLAGRLELARSLRSRACTLCTLPSLEISLESLVAGSRVSCGWPFCVFASAMTDLRRCAPGARSAVRRSGRCQPAGRPRPAGAGLMAWLVAHTVGVFARVLSG